MSWGDFIPGSLVADELGRQQVQSLQRDLIQRNEVIRRLTAENEVLRRKTDNRKKLSARDVALIRRLAENAKATQQELADSFDVNRATISRIISGVYHRENRA